MEVVGDFEFGNLDLLGSGAFAAVFKGRHLVVCNIDFLTNWTVIYDCVTI